MPTGRALSLFLLCAILLVSCSGTYAPSSITVSPASANVPAGQQAFFTATLAGNAAVIWEVNGIAGGNSTIGTISGGGAANGMTGTYTAPAAVPSPATVMVTAIVQTNSAEEASATATIGPFVVVSPVIPIVQTYATQQFSATVTGTSNTAVTWQVSCSEGGSACGAISQAGLYKAPNSVPTVLQNTGQNSFSTTDSVTVNAASQANPALSGSVVAAITSVNQQPQSTPIQLGASGSNSNDICVTNGVASCSGGTLGVVYQHVVPVETGTRDGWSAAETSMRTVPIVVMKPAGKMGGTFLRGVIGATVGPLAQGRLDKALSFSVGARRVGPRAHVLDPVLLTDLAKGA